jgi:hypothetical protein
LHSDPEDEERSAQAGGSEGLQREKQSLCLIKKKERNKKWQDQTFQW